MKLYSKFNKNSGFSLAEVLIALAIIGIVTAIALPLMLDNYRKNIYTKQLRKSFSELSLVMQNIIRESGGNDLIQAGFCSTGNNEAGAKALKSNFKIGKDCALNPSSGCFAPYNKYRSYSSRSTKRITSIPGYSVLLANGVALSLYCYSNTGDLQNPVASLYIDTNGEQGPNIAGRDFFRVYIYPEGVIDDYNIPLMLRDGSYTGDDAFSRRRNNFNNYCNAPDNPDGCIGRLINDDWKMNY